MQWWTQRVCHYLQFYFQIQCFTCIRKIALFNFFIIFCLRFTSLMLWNLLRFKSMWLWFFSQLIFTCIILLWFWFNSRSGVRLILFKSYSEMLRSDVMIYFSMINIIIKNRSSIWLSSSYSWVVSKEMASSSSSGSSYTAHSCIFYRYVNYMLEISTEAVDTSSFTLVIALSGMGKGVNWWPFMCLLLSVLMNR